MKEDIFDNVLTTVSNQLHVTQIMVTKPDFCIKRDDPFTILEVMQKKNYNIMPVKEEDKFIGYVEREFLAKIKQIEPAMEQIKFDILVSANTGIHEMIDLFQKSKFFFVNRGNDLVGLVTYADLDKIPVRIWLFILISKLEVLLLQLIKRFDTASWWNKLSDNRRKKITNLFDDKRKEDIDVSLIDCLNLGDMITIIQCDSKIRSLIGYISINSCKRDLGGLEKLRNNVMHSSNSLINNYEGVKKLNERIKRLQQAINRIEYTLMSSPRGN